MSQILMAKFKQSLESQGIKTEIIKDEATGKQTLINTQTGEIVKEYDTGMKPGTADKSNLQQIKQTDELGRETVV